MGVPGHNIDSFMIGSMEVPREDPNRRRAQDERELKEAEKQKKNRHGRALSPPCILSLDDEFKQLNGNGGGEGEGGEEEKEREVNEETLLENVIEERSEGDRSEGEGMEEGEEDGEMNWRLEEEIRLQEEMMAVKMEVEMMQKEKETWEKERKRLMEEKVKARAQREALEQ